jgi:hypothetical protein
VTATFAVALHGSVRGARQSVLELFRTSGEVDTAEYVLAGSEVAEDNAQLLRQLQHMSLHFGARWKLILHPVSFAARVKHIAFLRTQLLRTFSENCVPEDKRPRTAAPAGGTVVGEIRRIFKKLRVSDCRWSDNENELQT